MLPRLLLDENLPPGRVTDRSGSYPDARHVRDLGLQSSSDAMIWERAAADGFVIVTKDDDFRQRSFLYGAPPKVIWLRVGNCRRRELADLLIAKAQNVSRFLADSESALMVVSRLTR